MGLGHHHHHHSDHHHDHGGHAHGRKHSSRANLALAFVLNLAFAIIELIGGIWTGSVAIASEAIHDFGDSISLGAALFLEIVASRQSNARFSYGYRRLSLFSAALTGAILVMGAMYILYQAVPRLLNPVQPMTEGMLALAVLGIGVNGYAAWRVQKGKTLNERMISWHLLEDLLGWIVLFVVSIVMHFWDVPILDPILSIIFTVFILIGVLGTVRKMFNLFMQAAPEGVSLEDLRGEVAQIKGVLSVHDMHCWSLDGESHVLTMHVVVAGQSSLEEIEHLKCQVREAVHLRGQFHLTLEVEPENKACPEMNCVQF